jgi:HEAT repeat protein
MRFRKGDEQDGGRFGDARKARRRMPQPKEEGASHKSHRSVFDRVVFRFKEASNRDPEIRRTAMAALYQMGEDAVPVLSDILNDSTTARKVAKRILTNGYMNGQNDGNGEEEIDLEKFQGKVNSIRSASALLLGKIGAHLDSIGREEIAKTLIPALKDPNHDLRYWVAGAYCRLGDSSQAAMQQLISVAHDTTENRSVRHNAIEAIRKMEFAAKPAINMFIGMVKDDKGDESIRRASVEALGELGKYVEGKDQKSDLGDALLDRLDGQSMEIANAAVSSLLLLEGMYVNELVALMKSSDKSEKARVNAVWALAGISKKKEPLFHFIVAQMRLMKELRDDPDSGMKAGQELMSAIDMMLAQLYKEGFY